jgi:hypothetical protein
MEIMLPPKTMLRHEMRQTSTQQRKEKESSSLLSTGINKRSTYSRQRRYTPLNDWNILTFFT